MNFIATWLTLHMYTDSYAFVKIFLSSVCELLYLEIYQSNEKINYQISFELQVKEFVKVLEDIQNLIFLQEVNNKEVEIYEKIT